MRLGSVGGNWVNACILRRRRWAERVRRLEHRGVIQGYEARINPAMVGRTVRAIVDVSLVPGDGADAFEARVEARDEVVFAAYVTGSADYKVIVECVGADGLDRFVRWLRADEVVAPDRITVGSPHNCRLNAPPFGCGTMRPAAPRPLASGASACANPLPRARH